jgi:hypothetical protein
MHRRSASVIGVLSLCLSSAQLDAKCTTGYLEVKAEVLASPLIIDDAAIAGQFSIYNGPGAQLNGRQMHMDPDYQSGAIVDWPAGPQTPPSDRGQAVSVSFFCVLRAEGITRKMYEIDYAIPTNSAGGFIYFPGFEDPRSWANASSIAHDVEGQWYRASGPWERLVRPLIQEAIDRVAVPAQAL